MRLSPVLVVAVNAMLLGGCATMSLVSAIQNGDAAAVKRLLDQGASVDTRYTSEVSHPTLLIEAIDNKQRQLVTLLVERGANVNLTDNNGFSPLYWAARQMSEPEVCRYLIEHGADPNHKNADGRTDADYVKAWAHPDRALLIALYKATRGDTAEQTRRREADDAAVAAAAKASPRPAPSDDAQLAMSRGGAYFKQAKSAGEFTAAIDEMRKAAQLAPAWPVAWFNLALAEEGAGRWGDAAHHLQNYLTLSPDAENKPKILARIAALQVSDETGVAPEGR